MTRARVLLRRRGAVYPPAAGGSPDPAAEPGVRLLEADLVDRGWLLSPALRDTLLRVGPTELVGLGSALVADCDALLGADRPHVPLFRRFPRSVPSDTGAFFVDRVLAAWFQSPEQACVLCAREATVSPVSPCAHLVCRACFDPAEFSACPVCHRRLDPADPYLRAGEPDEAAVRRSGARTGGPQRLRVLHLGRDETADGRTELAALLARPGALPPGDVADLTALLAAEERGEVSWLPARIPGRETKARVLGWLLADPVPAGAVPVADRLVDTATDVLRLLVARSGGDSLVGRPRLAPVPRALRRALLAALDRIHPARLVEDMRRHRRAWIAVGERLHPGEYAGRYPRAALAFAAIRQTDLGAHPAGRVLDATARGLAEVEVRDGRVVVAGRGRVVEQALATGDVAAAVATLRDRPGELLRRADHLLRVADTAEREPVLAGLAEAARSTAPAVLLSALGELRTRAVPHRLRVFFPAGRTTAPHVVDDGRAPLPADLVDAAVRVLEDEVLRRAAALPPVDRAVVDAELEGLVAPFAERTAARALVTLARGSVLPVPAGRHLRLFCHWTESAQRVDLDLSVAVYDDSWRHVATCDYTSLRVPGAVHSGDLTSAPAPRGASEFIDLDVETLAAAGGRYAVVAVLSYNDVPFTEMAEAFAGFMLRAAGADAANAEAGSDGGGEEERAGSDGGGGEAFDARAVEQRFDLTGPGRVTIPFVVDLAERTMRWLDVDALVTGTDHAVHRHHDRFAVVADALTESFAAGARVTLGQLGRWIAAARAPEVLVRRDEEVWSYRRRAGESVASFAARLATADGDGRAGAAEAATAGVQFLLRGDLPAPPGAQVYALHPARLDADAVRLLAAADVPALLAPLAP
ncbi:MXAN_6230/SCO0854 family RING domain-containing protein [Micromonospora sp. NPDC049559]|uniref:MXAN_6230/SCO0854 family RING domain-containing protein n=1 Tax=Micromonospora sp. NPDC049559 TaxID=3155923 RepID=UPI00343579C0